MLVSLRVLTILSVMVFVALRSASGAEISNTLPADRVAAVEEAVRDAIEEQKLAGVAVGILQQGRIVFVGGYGEANREQHIPVTPATKFNWASNSKPIAAVLAMQLVEKGQLDLDADVRTYVPEFPAKNGVITTRHLLCHQSGIPHYANGKVVATPSQVALDDLFGQPILALSRFDQSPLLFQPGEKVSYSSYAYILLSAVIERAGKQPFLEQLHTRIAKPLELTSLDPDVGGEGPELAVGYKRNGDSIERSLDEPQAWKHGAGAYRSNVQDFARWAEAILNRRLVSEQTESAMWAIQPLKTGQPTNWGLGFTVENGDQGHKISHNGSQPETRTRMVLYPAAKHGVVVMSNSGDADVAKISTAIYAAMKD